MDSLIIEAINYVSKISKQKVGVESISTFLKSKGVNTVENDSILETLNKMQAKGLINKFGRPVNIVATSKTPESTPQKSKIVIP